mmetsp:Transcript_23198/g.50098  ORF Transcript_23198/g.50098 Transcript_23198/m.50098 type:complete len:138 (-) Transcript_23198:373-786(-)
MRCVCVCVCDGHLYIFCSIICIVFLMWRLANNNASIFCVAIEYSHYLQLLRNISSMIFYIFYSSTSIDRCIYKYIYISLAISMYEKFGYVTYRRVLGYYSGDDAEDALDMRKALPRDKHKRSVIPLTKPVLPEDLEW